MNRKTAHAIFTTIAAILTVICITGISPTWWIAAIVYTLAMIFLVLAFATSKRAEKEMREDEQPERKNIIEYVNIDEPSWTECYLIALREEIENAQM